MWVQLVQPAGEGTTPPSGYWRLEGLNNLYVLEGADENWYVAGGVTAYGGLLETGAVFLSPSFASQADAETALAAFVTQLGIINPS
jgi:hypothetical protein